ncbi:alcohol dehydrogenase catalytic domain-containing protein [Streptomyces sp. NPDC003011]
MEGTAVGVCGTDEEIAAGEYGWAPPGRERPVLGHESLGRVVRAPQGGGFAPGDLVVGVVRRPDPEPCGACGRGACDMCRNGPLPDAALCVRPGPTGIWRATRAAVARRRTGPHRPAPHRPAGTTPPAPARPN